MQILGKTLPEPVAVFLNDHLPAIEASCGHEVVWEWSRKLPEGFQAQYFLSSDGRPRVQLRPPKREELFGLTVAHEVAHLCLNVGGYPRAQSAAGVDPRLGLVLYNALLDIPVNTYLDAHGVATRPLERLLLANAVRSLFDRNVHEPTVLDVANTGLWTCLFVRLLLSNGLGISDEFHHALRGRYSATLRRAVALTQVVRDIGLDDPIRCAKAMWAGREFLKLESLIVIEGESDTAEA